MSMQSRQQGGSAIGLIITLAILGYGIFIGIQYVPQYIESSTVKTVLDTVVDLNNKERLESISAVESSIGNQLYINQLDDLKDSFKVTQSRGHYVITVSYERELDLGYTRKKIPFEKTVTLK